MAGEQILVVEDNAKNMTLFRDVLRATGYHTLEASTAGGALLLATEHGPSLVLMDIRLPDVDGLEALRRLRLDERTASIPVLAITAQAMKGDRERFEAAGFDGYLSKPVDIDELLTTVELHCGRRGALTHHFRVGMIAQATRSDVPCSGIEIEQTMPSASDASARVGFDVRVEC